MRNLAEFPVTPEEVLAHLERSLNVMKVTDGVGGMHAMIIWAVIQHLQLDRQVLLQVVERLKV